MYNDRRYDGWTTKPLRRSRIRTFALLHIVAASMLLAGCSGNEANPKWVSDIPSDIKKQVAFVCTHEKDRIPPRGAEADQLYRHARWLRKNNVLKQDPSIYPSIERLVRISAAYGHDKANIELRRMLEQGQAKSDDPVNEVIDLVQDLVKRGIPSGYHDMGWHLEHGYGVRADRDLAFKYYRKSADLGNPEAQYLVGDKLSDVGAHGTEIANIGWSMFKCAGDQRHAKGANFYAMYLQNMGRFAEALAYFQIGASAGKTTSASTLAAAFSAKGNDDIIYRLDQIADADRESRYKKLTDFLHDYEYLNPTVPELDEIVPLPPAKLPPWDGKFKWLEDHEANVPPRLPSEERISEMARAKGLDPKTGRPPAK